MSLYDDDDGLSVYAEEDRCCVCYRHPPAAIITWGKHCNSCGRTLCWKCGDKNGLCRDCARESRERRERRNEGD